MKDLDESFYVLGLETHRDTSKRNFGLFHKVLHSKDVKKIKINEYTPNAPPIRKHL